MMIDALASQPHYVDHLAPVWNALPEDARGVFTTTGRATPRAAHHQLTTSDELDAATRRLTLVAGHVDYVTASRAHRPTAYLNHGVGQAWRDERGRLIPTGCGQARPDVRVFLTPGPHATRTTREANGPTANIIQVGSPKVEALTRLPTPTEPLLVISTHWDQRHIPEARPALPAYLPALTNLSMPVALHAHPRLAWYVRDQAKNLGLEFIESFHEVCTRATLYATDTSSTLFEFAALNRPVLVLNSPKYRRQHHHGLRFWTAANVGVQVNDPSELATAVHDATADAPARQAARHAAINMAYHALDGQAAIRATQALLETLEALGRG